MSKRKDLTGEKFGNLTVIKKTGNLQDRYYTWYCRCDCGNEVIVSTKNLTAYRTTHCGCRAKELRNAHIKPKDRTGEKYGALTALQMVGKTDGGSFLWECECEMRQYNHSYCKEAANGSGKRLRLRHGKQAEI